MKILRTRYIEQEADLSKCCGCEQTIYSNMFVFWIKINREKPIKTDIFVCKSCYEILKNNNKYLII